MAGQGGRPWRALGRLRVARSESVPVDHFFFPPEKIPVPANDRWFLSAALFGSSGGFTTTLRMTKCSEGPWRLPPSWSAIYEFLADDEHFYSPSHSMSIREQLHCVDFVTGDNVWTSDYVKERCLRDKRSSRDIDHNWSLNTDYRTALLYLLMVSFSYHGIRKFQ